MLTSTDVVLLQGAYALLQSGDVAGAEAKLSIFPEQKLQYPDVVHLYAKILIANNSLLEAKHILERALKTTSDSTGLWQTYGNLLGDIGEFAGAKFAFEQASIHSPNSASPWYNLGLTAIDCNRLEDAANALDRAIDLEPDLVAAWNARGIVEQRRAAPDRAISLFKKALTIDPNDFRSRHNISASLREIDEPKAAIEQIELALSSGSSVAESYTIRAHLLADLQRFEEAINQYNEVIDKFPQYIDAHETLSRLLPQIGYSRIALDSYRRVIDRVPVSLSFWHSALSAAIDLHDDTQIISWAHDAEAAIGARPEFTLAKATALGRIGDSTSALALLQGLLATSPDDAAVHSHLSYTLLMLGDPKGAESHALRATELAPLDQFAWSYLTIIWRLLNDSREAWLADYDRMVMAVDLDPEWTEQPNAWLDPLRASVERLHTMIAHPTEQSLRGGTQTRGKLFEKRNPDMRGFADYVRRAVAPMLSGLPLDETHPFLRRNTGQIKFAGSWSVKLTSSGFHTNHIHQSGWLSSAFYLSLPPEVGTSQAGALTFGVPDAAFALNLAPRRVEIPRVGRLVLFPSYFWHGTVPFESKFPRLTMAFDALPA